jgi:hypothetical protein
MNITNYIHNINYITIHFFNLYLSNLFSDKKLNIFKAFFDKISRRNLLSSLCILLIYKLRIKYITSLLILIIYNK